MNWVNQTLQKAMSLVNKIKYRRTLNKKTTCEKHGKYLVLSLVLLGMFIGIVWTRAYYKGSEYFSEMIKVSAETVQARSEAKPEGELVGLTANDEGASSPTPSEIADLIWSRESSRGKNNFSKCEAKGMTNGIGMGVWGGNYMCFQDHAEEMKVLEDWIARHQEEGLSYIELLCHYSGNNYRECNQIK